MSNIVRSKSSDAAALTEIAKAAKSCWGYPKEWMEKWDGELTLTGKDAEENFVFHIEQEGKIMGFYSLSEDGGLFEVEHMWISPEYIDKGFGKALFEHAKEIALRHGGKKLRVESDPHAEGFYVKMGMRRVSEKESSIPGLPGRMIPIFEKELKLSTCPPQGWTWGVLCFEKKNKAIYFDVGTHEIYK